MMNQFLIHVLGTSDVPKLMALIFFAYLGALISLLIHATSRAEKNTVAFNFIYLVKDNAARIILNVILIAVSIRFFNDITGREVNMWGALAMGVTYDKLLELFRNLNLLDKKTT